MNADDRSIGANVRKLREIAGLSQGGLARAISDLGAVGIHQTTISRIESGERGLSLAEAGLLATALSVGVEDLLDVAATSAWLKHRAALQAIADLRRAYAEHRAALRAIDSARAELADVLPDLPIGQTRDLVEQALNPKETP